MGDPLPFAPGRYLGLASEGRNIQANFQIHKGRSPELNQQGCIRNYQVDNADCKPDPSL